MNLRNYFEGLNSAIWKGIVAELLGSILSCVFYFFSIYFVSELHFSIATTGYIISCYSVGTIIGGWLGGQLSDRIGSKQVTIIGLFLQALGYLVLTMLDQKFLLIMNALMLGTANYLSITGLYIMVLQYCHNDEQKKAKVLGLLAMMSNLGLSLSALLIGYFAQYSFNYIFLFVAIALIFLGVFVWFQQNPPFIDIVKDKISSVTSLSPIQKKTLLIVALLCVFLGGAIVMQYSSTYTIYIRENFLDYGVKGVSYLFALNCILVVILQTPISYLTRNQNKVIMIGVGAFLQGFSLLMLIFYHNYFYAMFAILISTIGEVIFFPSVQLICHTVSPPHKKGRGLGFYRSVYGASRAIGAGVGSFIYTHSNANTLWWIAGFTGALCLAICCWYKSYWK
jgi:predicted MFS family arabinose efflux permease